MRVFSIYNLFFSSYYFLVLIIFWFLLFFSSYYFLNCYLIAFNYYLSAITPFLFFALLFFVIYVYKKKLQLYEI